MSTIINWISPCYFNTDDGDDDEIQFDLTGSLRLILKNEVWNRKLEFGSNSNLRDVRSEDILYAKVKILPRFTSGYVNQNRIIDYVTENTNKVNSHFKINSYKDWHYALGVVVVEIKLNYKSSEIPSKNQHVNFTFDEKFLSIFHRHKALLNELATLFMAGLHFTYPTQSLMMWNDKPVNDGIYGTYSGRKKVFQNLTQICSCIIYSLQKVELRM